MLNLLSREAIPVDDLFRANILWLLIGHLQFMPVPSIAGYGTVLVASDTTFEVVCTDAAIHQVWLRVKAIWTMQLILIADQTVSDWVKVRVVAQFLAFVFRLGVFRAPIKLTLDSGEVLIAPVDLFDGAKITLLAILTTGQLLGKSLDKQKSR